MTLQSDVMPISTVIQVRLDLKSRGWVLVKKNAVTETFKEEEACIPITGEKREKPQSSILNSSPPHTTTFWCTLDATPIPRAASTCAVAL